MRLLEAPLKNTKTIVITRVPVVKGDGIGWDIMDAAVELRLAAGAKLEID